VVGWVRNESDGSVEAEVEGPAEDVEVLVSWFGHGPPQARVDTIEVEDRTPLGERRFVIR
jgi:acylphosphatase